ncbi:hypothetical protein J3P71_29865 (plasmid) [Rhizobium leguminosarum]|nr:hypothetical protein [Rhizobium leguminosarum]MBY5835714.1 hypothetical protein [Rhizobium leguminosarum]QSZ11908.1 hypothetical protein J3P71_29865 [Rhizobium leguminosarum]
MCGWKSARPGKFDCAVVGPDAGTFLVLGSDRVKDEIDILDHVFEAVVL